MWPNPNRLIANLTSTWVHPMFQLTRIPIYRSSIAVRPKTILKIKINVKNRKLWRQKNKNILNYFFNIFLFLSHLRSFLLIFFVIKTKMKNFGFLRGEPNFFKINKYSFARWQTYYIVTVLIASWLFFLISWFTHSSLMEIVQYPKNNPSKTLVHDNTNSPKLKPDKLSPYPTKDVFHPQWPLGDKHQCVGSFWAYWVGRDPSDAKSNRVTCSHLRVLLLPIIWGIF